MKWILLLYLNFGHPLFDEGTWIMSAVQMNIPYETEEECDTIGENIRLAGIFPENAIVAHHCVLSTWKEIPLEGNLTL